MASPTATERDALTLWQLLALTDAELERADLVALNIAVAKEIPSLAHLDVAHYRGVVDGWTVQFCQRLPKLERMFQAAPHKWKGDLRFFRFGMLQGFLGHEIGIRYIEEQKHATAVYYTDPSDLFLNGLIDTKQGTCGNMAALHVAMCRRMGWPVSLACVRSHFISRYDDGEVVHNVEATSTHPGAFASDPDEVYVRKFNLPRRAIDCGSDLRKLTAREMVGTFVASRGRHYADVKDFDRSDQSYALARALFPTYRKAYIAGMFPMLRRGTMLFDSGEVGHPDTLAEELTREFPGNTRNLVAPLQTFEVLPASQAFPPTSVYVIHVPD